MNIGKLLILIPSILISTNAHPFREHQTANTAVENPSTCRSSVTVYRNGVKKKFKGCQSMSNHLCVGGVDMPTFVCGNSFTNCDGIYWFDNIRSWTVVICEFPGVNVPCYVWDGAAIPSCEHVLLEARSQERDCSCISDHNGDKVCVPEGCDSPQRKLAQYQELTASDMVADETQCVCLVKGDSGRKVCQPANCDRGRTPPEIQEKFARILEDDTDCMCIKNQDGQTMCQPPNCYAGDTSAMNEDNFARILEDDTDCVCMKQGDGPKVCQPPNCDAGRPARF